MYIPYQTLRAGGLSVVCRVAVPACSKRLGPPLCAPTIFRHLRLVRAFVSTGMPLPEEVSTSISVHWQAS